MDILAARKKAVERAKARSEQSPERAAEAPAPPRDEEALPVPAPSRTAPMAPVETVPAAAGVLPVRDASLDLTVAAPAASADERGETPQQEIELLSFRLGGEEYALPVADVREVLKVVELTSVPNTPDYIPGIMSHRGTMLPILDLCRRFGLAPGVNDAKSRIVIVSVSDEEVGLLVDRVTGVFRISPGEIKPAPENIERGEEFLRGIARKNDRLYILLDLKKVVGL
jgi:purine-binding chemotaxis protein CheW